MRSTSFRLSVLIVPLVLGGVAVGVGCGSADVSAFEARNANAEAPAGEENAGGTFGSSPDASMNAASPYRGSPLCRATSNTCLPDDDGTRQSTYEPERDCERIPDGGVPDGGVAKGCRIQRHEPSNALKPQCDDANPQGTDGAECKSGNDCAPGFECIESPEKNVCRRYCCTGSCATATSQNGGKTFCDVQKVVPSTSGAQEFNAPVCMPLKACKLLTPGQCKVGETCAVVTEKGETGCVANGNAGVGQSCDEEHCNANLICLGQPGSRYCYALCRLDGSAAPCGPSQVCETSTLFSDKEYGVCKDASRAKPSY